MQIPNSGEAVKEIHLSLMVATRSFSRPESRLDIATYILPF